MNIKKNIIFCFIVLGIIATYFFILLKDNPFLSLDAKLGLTLIWSGLVILGWFSRELFDTQSKTKEKVKSEKQM